MKYTRSWIIALTAITLLTSLSGLASAQSSDNVLAGTGWTLTAINGQPPLAGTMVTLNFDAEGRVNGSDGCNSYATSYTVDDTSLTFGAQIISTMMACQDAVMTQAGTYQAVLLQTASFHKIGGQLFLLDADGATLLVFALQETDLVGTQWEVISYNNGQQAVVSTLSGTTLTANFGADGTLSGIAGCNNYFASFESDGKSTITIGPAATTRMLCSEPGGVMEQEAAYLAALATAATYQITGDQLHMRTADDALAVTFVRAATPADNDQPAGILLDPHGLAETWEAVSVPETPYDASMPPGPTGLPAHTQVLFDIFDAAAWQPGMPIMTIIPVDAYRSMWDENKDTAVIVAIGQIHNLIASMPSSGPISGVPALPYEITGGGINDAAAQFSFVAGADTSASKGGYRFVGRWTQEPTPMTNQGLFYVYQGFTNDGKYLVSFFYPVTTTALPDSVEQVSAADLAAVEADPGAYLQAQVAMLNALTPADWTPNLDTLDALVSSLQIEGMTSSGLLNRAWAWLGTRPGDSKTVTPLADPRLYEVTYNSDGTLTFVADCNRGNGTFTLQGGVTGSLTTTLGATTLAMCNDGDQGQQFMNALEAAQSFRVLPGGSVLELVPPAGDDILVFVSGG